MEKPCLHGIENVSRKGTTWKFCSHNCASAHKIKHPTELRKCKPCGMHFFYILRPNSNNSGTYCSTKCRNQGYSSVDEYGFKGHRSGWRSVRQKYMKGNGFCNDCGTMSGRLHVHHIEPYRMNLNDNPSNLVTLCPKCHSSHENVSNKIEMIKDDELRASCVAIIQARFEDQWHLIQGRKLSNDC